MLRSSEDSENFDELAGFFKTFALWTRVWVGFFWGISLDFAGIFGEKAVFEEIGSSFIENSKLVVRRKLTGGNIFVIFKL